MACHGPGTTCPRHARHAGTQDVLRTRDQGALRLTQTPPCHSRSTRHAPGYPNLRGRPRSPRRIPSQQAATAPRNRKKSGRHGEATRKQGRARCRQCMGETIRRQPCQRWVVERRRMASPQNGSTDRARCRSAGTDAQSGSVGTTRTALPVGQGAGDPEAAVDNHPPLPDLDVPGVPEPQGRSQSPPSPPAADVAARLFRTSRPRQCR